MKMKMTMTATATATVLVMAMRMRMSVSLSDESELLYWRDVENFNVLFTDGVQLFSNKFTLDVTTFT